MTLHAPCIITARLLPGVQIGNGFISIDPTGRRDWAGRMIWRYYIDFDGTEHTGADLATHGNAWGGAGWAQEALADLLAFLGAAAESYPDGENADLFPGPLVEWAHQWSDEISMVAKELEETENLIEE